MPVTALFLWTSAAETNSLQSLYTRLSALPPPAIQQVRPAKHILSYHILRSMSSDSSAQTQTLYQISLPHHQTEPSSHFWIHDDASGLTVTEMAGTFPEIMAKIDSGWQERQGTGVTLEGRGFEWGRDWRIWCANLKQANRYRGVIVEVQYIPATSLFSSKLLLTQFAERHIFRPGEQVRSFWGKRLYPPATFAEGSENLSEKEFENWHTGMQYIEMIQFVAIGRRRSSAIALE